MQSKAPDIPLDDGVNASVGTTARKLATPARAAPAAVWPALDSILELFFRIGFASIFLVNSAYAAFKPQDFTDLLYENPITHIIGYTDGMVIVAMVNDLLLGILIVSGWRQRWVYGWAGIWLVIVAGLKMMNLAF